MDRGRGRGTAGARSPFEGTGGGVADVAGVSSVSSFAFTSAVFGSGSDCRCSSTIRGVAGSDIGDGGTSTIATGTAIGVGTGAGRTGSGSGSGSGSGVWPLEMTGGVTIAA